MRKLTIDEIRDVNICHEFMKSLDINRSPRQLLADVGVSYFGATDSSVKSIHSTMHGTKCYFLYLAPADDAGQYIDINGTIRDINVCPNSAACRPSCLVDSGMSKVEQLSNRFDIKRARLIKTKLLHERPDIFMKIVSAEIARAKESAERLGYDFAVRLNATSDIDWTLPKYDVEGFSVFNMFHNVQFYDYTKVAGRLHGYRRPPNYHLTLSYNGHNENVCIEYLNQGGGVAVIFKGKLPNQWWGFPVINGDLFDMRYYDRKYFKLPENKGYIIGLKYKAVVGDIVESARIVDESFFVSVAL